MTIHRRLLTEGERINSSANHFGDNFPFRIEPTVYTFARQLSVDYTGGYWHFYELDNGCFYMAPDEDTPFQVSAENGYSGTMSADAFGLTVCLYAYSNLSFTDNEELADTVTEQYHLLREYIFEHPGVRDILRAID